MMTINDDFKRLGEDEALLMAIERKPDRGIIHIDVGNASVEVVEVAVKKLKEKLRKYND
jgi:hypothetical protein